MKKDYSIVQNMFYVTKKMMRYDKLWAPLMFLGSLFELVGEFVVIFLPKLMVEHIVLGDSWQSLLIICFGMGFLLIISRSLGSVSRHQMHSRLINVRMHMIMDKMNHANLLPYELLEQPDILNQAQLAQFACDDNVNGIEGMMQRVYVIFFDVVKILLSITILFILSWVFIIAVLLMAFLHFYFFNKNIESDKKNTWDPMAPKWRQIGYYRHLFSDFAYGKDIRLYQMKPMLEEKMRKVHDEAHHYISVSKRRWAWFGVFTNLTQAILEAIVYGLLINWYVNAQITVADFTFYSVATFAFFRSLSGLLYGMAQTKRCSLATNDYRSFMEIPIDVDHRNATPPPSQLPTIRFENVTFRYTGQTHDALSNINLVIHPGEKLAVVGLNGAGKSTLIKLLMRLYRPTSGTITMDGVDVWSMSLSSYHALFAPLFQDIELYAFELAENVAMKSNHAIDESQLHTVLEQSGLAEFTNALPQGTKTKLLKILDEDGIDLSGGQKQKLAFARALYKDASIIVLDEPTASLDAVAEHELYIKFNDLVHSKTAIFISHRLSSTRFCDRIIYLDSGKIIEDGSHEQLMSIQGAYRSLFDLQAKYYAEGAIKDETID